MKTIIKIMAGAAVAALFAVGASAQTVTGSWSAIGQGSGLGAGQGSATNTWAVAPAGSGAPRVLFVSAGTDKSGALLKFYTNSNPTVVSSNLAAGGSNIVYASSTSGGIGAVTNGDLLIIRHVVSNTTYEVFPVHTATATTFTLSGTTGTGLSNALSIGDLIYKVGNWGTNGGISSIAWTAPPNGPNTNTFIGTNSVSYPGGAYTGQAGSPLLIQLDTTAAGAIRVVSGDYVK